MKLKLTHAEFIALLAFFEHMIKGAKPQGMSGKMLHSILMSVYEKLYKKAFHRKDRYAISLHDHEALGFWFFFKEYQFDSAQIFEANLIHAINNRIHQKYS